MQTKEAQKEHVINNTTLIDSHTHIGIDVASFYKGHYPYGITSEDHVVRMDISKIDVSITFPWVYTNYFQLRPYMDGIYKRDPQSGFSAPYEFENARMMREIYEDFPEFSNRFLPFAFFDPARKQKEQVECLRKLEEEYPVFGLKTASTYLQSSVLDLLGKGACLLDFAAEKDLPVTLHSAVMPGDSWAQVHDIIKIVEARPDVRFAIAHTCRFDRKGLDRAAELPNCFVDCSAFHIHCLLAKRKRPAVALGKAQFPAPYENHAEALRLIAETYPDTITWGTDTSAHYWKGKYLNDKGEWVRSDLPCGPLTEIEEFRKLPKKIRTRIGHTNTVRFLFG